MRLSNLKEANKMVKKRIVDLSLTLRSGMATWPGAIAFNLIDRVTHGFTAPRYILPCEGFADKIIVSLDHAGTHVDAPYHFFPEKLTIDKVPVDTFMGEAVMIDVSAKGDEFISEEVLKKAVKEQKIEIKKGDIVLIRAWPKGWGEPGFFETKGFSKDGAEWLRNKGIKAVGIDLGGCDTSTDMTRPSHMVFLGSGIPIYETLVNLDKIGAKRFTFIGLPCKFEGATGSPLRAVAVVEDEEK